MGEPRKIVFVDRYEPPLEAGEYELTVVQTVEGKESFKESFANLRRFYVRGERFALDPGEVVAVFPPAGSAGGYAAVLPHVVLERRTLPWERSLGGDRSGTWLALLLLTEDEAKQSPLQALRVRDLTCPPKGTVSYSLQLEPGEHESDPCQVIDLPVDLFMQIAPKSEDVDWLAHARSVPAGGKAGVSVDPTVARSIVVGNRLPAKNTSSVCHLVSLEGLVSYLPNGAKLPKEGKLRLVSLKSWSFTSVDAKKTFSSYFFGDDFAGSLRLAHDRVGTNDDAKADVANALDLGYVAFDHQTRFGDTTVSWYRGPLLPYETGTIVPPPDGGVVIEAADNAVRYDPATGMMDISYAAAWQLGRLLALANRSFSVSLGAWKRGTKLKTLQAVADKTIADRFASVSRFAELAAEGHKGEIAAEQLLTKVAPKREVVTGVPAATGGSGTSAALVHGGALVETVSNLTADHLAAIHSDTEVPDDLTSWLRDLVELSFVPFAYLVPAEAMLPPEALRFFVVDRNWINALLEGATSIGRVGSSAVKHDNALAGRLYRAAAVPATMSGFLLHSPVVDGWPGLEVTAFDDRGAVIGASQVVATLKEDAAVSSTKLIVAEETTGFPDPDTPHIQNDAVHVLELTVRPTPEIARCTAVTGGALTLERGQAGPARELRPGDLLECDSGRISVSLKSVLPKGVTVQDESLDFPPPPFEVSIHPVMEKVRCTAIDDNLREFTVEATARGLHAGDEVSLTSPRVRFERLGPSLLLFLTTGKLAEVHIHEPAEGLHFGFSQVQLPENPEGLNKQLRSAAGCVLTDLKVSVVVNGARRVDVDALQQATKEKGGDDVKNSGRWTAAEFALQLVEGVESVCFEVVPS